MAQGAEVKILHRRGDEGGCARAGAAVREGDRSQGGGGQRTPAGGLARRIQGGETFDLAVITPGVLNDLAGKGKEPVTRAQMLHASASASW